MELSNKRPPRGVMAKSDKKSNVADSKLTCEIRKRLIFLTNKVKYDAYALMNSDQIVEGFINELNDLRLKASTGDYL